MSEHSYVPTVLNVLHDPRLSAPWRALLGQFADELERPLTQDELRRLMSRVGQRFAADHPLLAGASTHDHAVNLNAHWATIRCGRVRLVAARDEARLTHYGTQLGFLGASALTGTLAFLEGSYQRWLEAMGAAALSVVRMDVSEDGVVFEFRLLRQTTGPVCVKTH